MVNLKIGTGNNDEVANGTHAIMDKMKWKQPLMVVVPVIIALTAVGIGAISPPAIGQVEATSDNQAKVDKPVIPAKFLQPGQLMWQMPILCPAC